MRIGLTIAAAGLCASGVAAQELTPQQAEIIRNDPPMPRCQRLAILHHNDAPTGPARELFNGRDLTGWEPWLGYADPSMTFRQNSAAPLGTGVDPAQVFTVVTEDGVPAIRAGGAYWGSLATVEEFAGVYHLSLEYKWGPKIWPPAKAETRNNGLLYHSFGPPGAVFGTWRKSVEFQLQHGSVGMAIPLGNDLRARILVGQDKAIPYPHRRFSAGGREIELANGTPAWNVEAARDMEKPVGQWNRIDLYVDGNRSIHVVNGEPVMQISGLSVVAPDGTRTALDRGHIQLQSEGAETFFRNVRIEPIRMLPRVGVLTPRCK
jgi:hypothetical protein